MPDPESTQHLAEQLCARLCHDLAGLAGTIDGVLDLMTEQTGQDDEILAYARAASRALSQRLRLLRAAWVPGDEEMSWTALCALSGPPLAARRIELKAGVSGAGVLPPATARMVLNLLLLAADWMPKGGTITLTGELTDVLVHVSGSGAAWPPDLIQAEPRHETTSVQLALTMLLAQTGGFRLTPVTGAMRLTLNSDEHRVGPEKPGS